MRGWSQRKRGKTERGRRQGMSEQAGERASPEWKDGRMLRGVLWILGGPVSSDESGDLKSKGGREDVDVSSDVVLSAERTPAFALVSAPSVNSRPISENNCSFDR